MVQKLACSKFVPGSPTLLQDYNTKYMPLRYVNYKFITTLIAVTSMGPVTCILAYYCYFSG